MHRVAFYCITTRLSLNPFSVDARLPKARWLLRAYVDGENRIGVCRKIDAMTCTW